MKIAYLLMALLIAACMDPAGPATGSATQNLCTVNSDTCPGWPLTTTKQKTIEFTNAAEATTGNTTPVFQPSCNKNNGVTNCSSHTQLNSVDRLDTFCHFYDEGGFSCSGSVCHTPTTTGEGCVWQCFACPLVCPPETCHTVLEW